MPPSPSPSASKSTFSKNSATAIRLTRQNASSPCAIPDGVTRKRWVYSRCETRRGGLDFTTAKMMRGRRTSEDTGVGVETADGGSLGGVGVSMPLYEGGRGTSSGRAGVVSAGSGARVLDSVAGVLSVVSDGSAAVSVTEIETDGGGVSGRGGGGPRFTSAPSTDTRAVGDTTIPDVSANMLGGASFLKDARARSSSSVNSLMRGSLERPSKKKHN